VAAAGIVLVDTMIVIEAVDTRCWNAITGQKRVVTVQECEDELRRGDQARPGYVTVTREDIARCQVVALSTADRAEFQLGYPGAQRLDHGERDLLALAGAEAVRKVDALDPSGASAALAGVLGWSERDDFARIVCPLGTKPQTLGVYDYLRKTDDPPAIVYAGPLRHNHTFYSKGLGQTWVLKTASDQ